MCVWCMEEDEKKLWEKKKISFVVPCGNMHVIFRVEESSPLDLLKASGLLGFEP